MKNQNLAASIAKELQLVALAKQGNLAARNHLFEMLEGDIRRAFNVSDMGMISRKNGRRPHIFSKTYEESRGELFLFFCEMLEVFDISKVDMTKIKHGTPFCQFLKYRILYRSMSEFRNCAKNHARYSVDSDALDSVLNGMPREGYIASDATFSGNWKDGVSTDIVQQLNAVMGCLPDDSKEKGVARLYLKLASTEKNLMPAVAKATGETRATIYNIFKRIRGNVAAKLPKEYLHVAA